MNLDPPMSQDSLLDTLRDSDQPGLAAREFLEAGQARLDAAFHEAPITELVHGRARLVDRVLIAAWSLFGLDRFAEAALVAVGGYGRGELHPHSDVDLMVLREFKQVSDLVAFGVNLAFNVRCNYGVSIMTSQLGCEITYGTAMACFESRHERSASTSSRYTCEVPPMHAPGWPKAVA